MTNEQIKNFMKDMLMLAQNGEDITTFNLRKNLWEKSITHRYIVEIVKDNYVTFRTLEDAEQYLEQFDRESKDYIGRIIDVTNININQNGQCYFESIY